MLRTAILGFVLIVAGFGSVSAGECGKLCDRDWWKGDPTKEEVAAEIANSGANARGEDGVTPLHTAAAWGTPANITVLLKAGAILNTRDDFGFSPLHRSVAGSIVSIKVLLKAGAKVNARDDFAKTPLHVAAILRHLR